MAYLMPKRPSESLIDSLKRIADQPGVYRFYDQQRKLLYVGKAKNLKKRVLSYFRADVPARIHHMVAQIATFEMTYTHHEKEALLLENNFIKHLKPKYNIQLRDDKSYPFLWLSEHPYPRLSVYRGARKEGGTFFGPYPSVSSVRAVLDTVQKTFQVRSCSDTFFAHRNRPCLEYQLKRCTAPCVAYVDQTLYAEQISASEQFLKGRNQAVLERLVQKMNQYSQEQAYEQAALYRDRIQALRRIQQGQSITAGGLHKGDVMAMTLEGQTVCMAIWQIREGSLVDTQTVFFEAPIYWEEQEIWEHFLTQHYWRLDPLSWPAVLYLPEGAHLSLAFQELFLQVSQETQGHALKIELIPKQGPLQEWFRAAQHHGKEALEVRFSGLDKSRRQWEQLRGLFHGPVFSEQGSGLLVCFDISHALGEATVASCICLEWGKPHKALYRTWNIRAAVSGDDYGALREALGAYRQCLEMHQMPQPEMILIDGGKGQLQEAVRLFSEEARGDFLILLSMAKGPARRVGQETLFCWDAARGEIGEVALPSDTPAFHLLQRARDEAHRFAIKRHRQQRRRKRMHSTLEDISGVGPKRRQALLAYFGGLQGLMLADAALIATVPGISHALAERIVQGLQKNQSGKGVS